MPSSAWLVGALGAVVASATGCLWDTSENDDHAHLQIPTELEMTAECGKDPKFFPLAIYNHPDKDLTITGATTTGEFAVIDPLPVVVPGGETGAVTVLAPRAVVGTDQAHTRKIGKLVLATSEGDFPVDLLAQIVGADLQVTDTAGQPLALAFTDSQCPAPITAKITNFGNVGFVFTAPTPTAFRIEGFTSGMIGPGESKTITVRPYTTSACTVTETISFTAQGLVCTLPVQIQASFTMTGSATCSCP